MADDIDTLIDLASLPPLTPWQRQIVETVLTGERLHLHSPRTTGRTKAAAAHAAAVDFLTQPTTTTEPT